MGVDLRTWPKDPMKYPQILLAKTINESDCTLQMKQFDLSVTTLTLSLPNATVVEFTDHCQTRLQSKLKGTVDNCLF